MHELITIPFTYQSTLLTLLGIVGIIYGYYVFLTHTVAEALPILRAGFISAGFWFRIYMTIVALIIPFTLSSLVIWVPGMDSPITILLVVTLIVVEGYVDTGKYKDKHRATTAALPTLFALVVALVTQLAVFGIHNWVALVLASLLLMVLLYEYSQGR